MSQDCPNFLAGFENDGFSVLKHAITNRQIANLVSALELSNVAHEAPKGAGVRGLLRDYPIVREFARSESVIDIAGAAIGADARPVRAILFDKTATTNWYVTWHQDITIAVLKRIDAPGFGPWSVKDGIIHVQPQIDIIENMVSLRVHLDDCPADNGAIKFIPGSHKKGILDQSEIHLYRDGYSPVCCPAERGDVIVMRPLILHSSQVASSPKHRRVLHIEYASGELPFGLEWAEA